MFNRVQVQHLEVMKPGSKTNPNFQLVNKILLDQSTPVILLQNVMVSPGTHPAKNYESQSRIIESQFKNMSP